VANPLLRQRPPAWKQKFQADLAHCHAVTLSVTVHVDPTDEVLVDQVTSTRGGSIARLLCEEVQSNLESLTHVRNVAVSVDTAEDKLMTIKFISNDKGTPPGKLADAELHFSGGPLDDLRLVGFVVWERKTGGRNVTFPARQYSMNGERRSYALLRPAKETQSQNALRDLILEAYREHEAALSPEV
jgi:hypothetical protein